MIAAKSPEDDFATCFVYSDSETIPVMATIKLEMFKIYTKKYYMEMCATILSKSIFTKTGMCLDLTTVKPPPPLS